VTRRKALSAEEATAALADAEGLLERWTSGVSNKQREAEVLAAELAEAQARAGDDLLDDEDEDAITRIAEALRIKQVEQGVAAQAAERASERLCGIRREVLQARGAVLLLRAEALRDAAAARQARTDQLLAELADFEGVDMGPVRRSDSLGVVSAGFTPMTLTQRTLKRAQWLTDHARGHREVAEQGTDDQVAQWVNQGVPPRDEVEFLVAPAEVATGDRPL
jgi:hypothetical protein